MIIKKELIKRDIAGEVFLVPVGSSMYDSNGLFILSELGAFIWDLLPDAASEEDILRCVLAEYEVDEPTARADIHEFLGKLENMGIL
jgi:hypothetical protein